MAPLIGRARELDRLAALAGLAGPGGPGGDGGHGGSGLAVLSGDAGIGKTRLLAELAELAERRGRTVLLGHCVDLADSPLPYLPFLEIIAALIDARGPDRMVAQRGLLADHPGLAPLLDRAGTTQPDRGALIEGTWSALNETARDRPLLVIIEDAHWADRSSLELISYLLARPCPAPVSVVISYRSDDLDRDHPLRPVLAGWVRLRAVGRIELDPLPEPAIRELVATLEPRALAAGGLTEAGLRQLITWSGGNAFFIEELLSAGAEQCGLPDDLAELLLLRLERLGPTGQRVARALSVAGHPVGYDLLGRVTGLPADELDLALREGTRARLLVAGDDERFAFRHALLAEAIRRDLLPGERIRLHQAYLTALTAEADWPGTGPDAMGPDPRGGTNDAELARHALAAGDHRLAYPATVRAAEAAVASAGPAEALRHYEIALRLAEDPEVEANPAELAVEAGRCALAAGQPDRAAMLIRRALARPGPAPLERAALLHTLASIGLQSDQPIDPLAATTEALALTPTEPSEFRTRLLASHVLGLALAERDEEALATAAEAVPLAERFDLPDAFASIRTAQSWVAAHQGDPHGTRAALHDAAEAAKARNDPAELRARYNLGGLAMEDGDLPRARGHYEDASRRGAELGLPYAPFALEARVHAAIVAYQQGDWDAVLSLTDCSEEAAPELARATLAAARLPVLVGRGEDPEPWLELARPGWSSDGKSIMLSASAGIDAFGAAGDLDAADRLHAEAVAAAAAVWQVSTFQGRIRLAALLIGQYANAVRTLEPAERRDVVTRLSALAEEAGAAHDMGRRGRVLGPESRAWQARLTAETLRLRRLADVDAPATPDLIAAWEDTVAAFERYPHPYERARSEARFAGVLRSIGDPARAGTLAEAARATARRLGAGPLLTELGADAAERDPDQVLTPRERQVLALVAEGRSNGEVAAALVISTKTASVHVSNILAKLGAASRTEAAALARRRGLLDS